MNKLELLEQLEDGVNIVDFWAEWCGPCKSVGPILDEINSANKDVNLIKVDVDSNSELADEFSIKSIPSIFFLSKEGDVIKNITGTRPQSQFESIIEEVRGL